MTHHIPQPWAAHARVRPSIPTPDPCPLWSTHPLFNGLSETDFTLVSRYFTSESLVANESLCEVDTDHGLIGIVLKGALREDANRGQREGGLLGLVFAGGLLCPRGPRLPRLTSTALCDTEVWTCPAEDFPTLAQRVPQLALNLITATQNRLTETMALYHLRGCQTALERVAGLLTHIAARQGHPDVVSLYLSRQDLGALAALTPETVSRQIKALERAGILSLLSPTKVMIRDHARLLATTGAEPRSRLAS